MIFIKYYLQIKFNYWNIYANFCMVSKVQRDRKLIDKVILSRSYQNKLYLNKRQIGLCLIFLLFLAKVTAFQWSNNVSTSTALSTDIGKRELTFSIIYSIMQ